MRPHGTAQELERRRHAALTLLREGMALQGVASRVGVSFASVFRWQQAARAGGVEALRAKPVPGRPRKLDSGQRKRLMRVLLKGAREYGFPNELWTLERIASVIREEFGVRYHPNHVWRILRSEGWSCQVPERRAMQRDEAEIEHWKRYKWPQIKKSSKTWRPSRLSR